MKRERFSNVSTPYLSWRSLEKVEKNVCNRRRCALDTSIPSKPAAIARLVARLEFVHIYCISSIERG